jgi:dTDP-glucose 4,6-dehydratase
LEYHVRALRVVARAGRPGERYNIGSSNEQRNVDIVRRICTIMDELRPSGRPHAQLISFVADRPGHDWRYAVDAGKLRRELGWRPLHSLDSALEQTVCWYLANETWWRPLQKRSAGSDALAADRDTLPKRLAISGGQHTSGETSRRPVIVRRPEQHVQRL